MLLTTPYVLGIDESPQRNQLRQIAVPVQAIEGTLVTFTRDRVSATFGHERESWVSRSRNTTCFPGTGAKRDSTRHDL